MDAKLAILGLIALVGIIFLTMYGKKVFKNSGGFKTLSLILGLGLLLYAGVGAGAQFGWYDLGETGGKIFLSASDVPSGTGNGGVVCSNGQVLVNGVCQNPSGGATTYQPTASYTTVDKFAATTTVSGTSYYKINSEKATTTAQTNVNKGDQITYWVDNSTYWVKPAVETAGNGVTPVQAESWNNGTATVTIYDTVNRQDTTSGAYNTSMGANKQGNIEITYQGTAKKSASPFGGVMVSEYNSTISSLTCTGDDLLDSNPYHVTYTVTSTANTWKPYAYGPSIDDGSGSVRRVSCQFVNGATAVGAGSAYYFKFIPANYYVTNDGDIVLDTEKFANGVNTRTGSVINQPSVTGYWGA